MESYAFTALQQDFGERYSLTRTLGNIASLNAVRQYSGSMSVDGVEQTPSLFDLDHMTKF